MWGEAIALIVLSIIGFIVIYVIAYTIKQLWWIAKKMQEK